MHILKRLFILLIPYRRQLVISAVLLVFRAGLELAPPLFQKAVIDEIISAGNLTRLGLFLAGLVGVYALTQLVNIGDNFIRHALGEKFILDLRVRLYAYLQRLSLSFFERTSTGELMSRITNDLAALEHFVTHGSALTAVDLLRLAGGLVILLVLDARLALLACLSPRSRGREGKLPSCDRAPRLGLAWSVLARLRSVAGSPREVWIPHHRPRACDPLLVARPAFWRARSVSACGLAPIARASLPRQAAFP